MIKNIYIGNDKEVKSIGKVEITFSPKELAAAFKEMTNDEKALFFEELHKAYKGEECFSEEIKNITKSKRHTLNGKWMMFEFGQRV